MSNREIQLTYAIKNLPLKDQKNFSKALIKHPFNLELYVPKNFNNKHQISNKNCLRNKLVQFNDVYNAERSLLEQLKKETSEFSTNYKIVNNMTPGEEINRRLETYGDIIDKYKCKGYDEEKLFPKTNIFEPSILLEEDKMFENVYLVGNHDEYEKDLDYIQNTSSFISARKNQGDNNNNYRKQNTELKKRDNNINFENSKSVIFPSIHEKRQLKKINNLLERDIKNSERMISDITQSTSFNMTNFSKIKKTSIVSTVSPKKKKSVIEKVFLSSKGMKISAKKRKKENKANQNKVHSRNSISVYNNKKRKELQTLYNHMIQNGFKKTNTEILQYLQKYKNSIPEQAK